MSSFFSRKGGFPDGGYTSCSDRSRSSSRSTRTRSPDAAHDSGYSSEAMPSECDDSPVSPTASVPLRPRVRLQKQYGWREQHSLEIAQIPNAEGTTTPRKEIRIARKPLHQDVQSNAQDIKNPHREEVRPRRSTPRSTPRSNETPPVSFEALIARPQGPGWYTSRVKVAALDRNKHATRLQREMAPVLRIPSPPPRSAPRRKSSTLLHPSPPSSRPSTPPVHATGGQQRRREKERGTRREPEREKERKGSTLLHPSPPSSRPSTPPKATTKETDQHEGKSRKQSTLLHPSPPRSDELFLPPTPASISTTTTVAPAVTASDRNANESTSTPLHTLPPVRVATPHPRAALRRVRGMRNVSGDVPPLPILPGVAKVPVPGPSVRLVSQEKPQERPRLEIKKETNSATRRPSVLHSCFSDSESDAWESDGDETRLIPRRCDSGREWDWDGGRARAKGGMCDERRGRTACVAETATATAVRVVMIGKGRAC